MNETKQLNNLITKYWETQQIKEYTRPLPESMLFREVEEMIESKYFQDELNEEEEEENQNSPAKGSRSVSLARKKQCENQNILTKTIKHTSF